MDETTTTPTKDQMMDAVRLVIEHCPAHRPTAWRLLNAIAQDKPNTQRRLNKLALTVLEADGLPADVVQALAAVIAPSLKPGYMLRIRLTVPQQVALFAEANRRGLTVSDMVRNMLGILITDWPEE